VRGPKAADIEEHVRATCLLVPAGSGRDMVPALVGTHEGCPYCRSAGVSPAVAGASRSRRPACGMGILPMPATRAGRPCHSGRDARGTSAASLSGRRRT
jgi:hypothetical protein